jgi:hypothetical protein
MIVGALWAVWGLGGCVSSEKDVGEDTAPVAETDPTGTDPAETDAVETDFGVVHVVLFTHIEDNTPVGDLGSPPNRQAYLRLRGELVAVAERAQARGLPFVVQPDWKLLEAARLYEDTQVMSSTGGVNVFVHLRDALGCTIDPHSHENGGYNYTDVAHLLDLLGVGGSSVIGGHIWDPSLPQFQGWDRFRVAQAGERYPEASWRGDLLIGAGTPNHVNDPLVSGVWRPADRDHFFDDDPAGNIVSVGAWDGEVAGVEQLVAAYADGTVPRSTLLTASWNIPPSTFAGPTGADELDEAVFAPIQALRDAGAVAVVDFQALVATWTAAGAVAGVYAP